MSSQETFYFGAGPATLPLDVLKKIQSDLLDFNYTGLSILELSHRSEEFTKILAQAEILLRDLMQIPQDYAVLFMHGGATAQYSMLPLNFLQKEDKADYICTGHWSTKAFQEAKQFANVNQVKVLDINENISILPIKEWQLDDSAYYLHYCDNETISGVAFYEDLILENKKVFCDVTSSILAKPITVTNYDLVYASAQKNLGIAGLCIVVIKKDLLAQTKSNAPSVFNYLNSFTNNSLVNTPPIFAIYVLSLTMQWLQSQGGVKYFAKMRERYANSIYELIDNSELFINKIAKNNRSLINIAFDFKNQELREKFLLQAEKQKLLGLRGHQVVGGARISLYNAMSEKGVQCFIKFMRDFDCRNA